MISKQLFWQLNKKFFQAGYDDLAFDDYWNTKQNEFIYWSMYCAGGEI